MRIVLLDRRNQRSKQVTMKLHSLFFILFYYYLESRCTIYSYLEIGLKPAIVGCFTNAIAPLPIALESCSNPFKIRQVF